MEIEQWSNWKRPRKQSLFAIRVKYELSKKISKESIRVLIIEQSNQKGPRKKIVTLPMHHVVLFCLNSCYVFWIGQTKIVLFSRLYMKLFAGLFVSFSFGGCMEFRKTGAQGCQLWRSKDAEGICVLTHLPTLNISLYNCKLKTYRDAQKRGSPSPPCLNRFQCYG